ncbi:hypothetical protein N0V85_007728 [Neurospora sp. IMI 360204]|nr:hypothetical protein N0V85_007728 [Neurospora sp. IMI 360204]
MLTITTSLAYSLLLGSMGSAFAILQQRQFDGGFDWSSVEPAQQLQYHDCYDGFRCARLKVPLDWTKSNNDSDNNWVAIGIITLPATVPETDSSFGGTVLVNPGGPGGSGTEMALELGGYLQGILEGGDRHYEILGFDPRGVALSTPRADCYNGDNFNRAADNIQKEGMPPVAAGAQSLAIHYQAAKGLSDLCAAQAGGPKSIFNYMSTASVARDMLEIVERVDELRQKTSTNSSSTTHEKPRLQYIGVSYGTILGNTFASMFPGRITLASSSRSQANATTTKTWLRNLNDAELVVDHFYETCFKAGHKHCALTQPSDKDASNIRGRVDHFIQELIASPVSVVAADGRIRLITSIIVRDAIRQTLYSPISLYEPLSNMLAEALAGNYTLLSQSPAAMDYKRNNVCDKPVMDSSFPPPEYTWDNEATIGVLCGDSAAASASEHTTLSWAQDIVKKLEAQSPTTAEPWSRIPLACLGWKFQPKYAFGGPFGHSSGPDARHTPSAPMLILSNRYDHATPLRNAHSLSKAYPGSVVLVQESFGHCALLTSKSACTAEHVRSYFESGKVPERGSTCSEDCRPSIPYTTCPGFPR